jgi:hypothetical protein
MLFFPTPKPPTGVKAHACALRVAHSQGLKCKPGGDERSLKLGRWRVVVEGVEFVDIFGGSRRPAPPRIIRAVHPGTFSEGTLEELRCRLASVTALEALIDESFDINDVEAALDFVRHRGWRFPVTYAIAAEDFRSWRVLTGDFGAWFAMRFVKTRMFAA